MNLNPTAKESSATSSSSLCFSPLPPSSTDPSEVIIIGRQPSLASNVISLLLHPGSNKNADAVGITVTVIDGLLKSIEGSSGSDAATTFVPLFDGGPGKNTRKVTVMRLPPPDEISRNNHPFSPHAVSDMLEKHGLNSIANSEGLVQIHVLDDRIREFACPIAAAIARALPLYHSKSTAAKKKKEEEDRPSGVRVSFRDGGGGLVADESLSKTANAVAHGVRLAARLGDMPPAELNPDSYAAECEAIAKILSANGADVAFEEIRGEELRDGGYGGIYGVGMAGMCPPRMVVMTYTPKGVAEEHVALCGKGVIYDTGGLALKPKVGMCGMKHDMGGSAGVLGAFQAAVQLELPRKITLVLAIVENSVGPTALRNDDVLTMKSGKTVEINNTDAEGRLILADCVSHASNRLEGVDVILDMATLTGAQLVTTGKKHAGALAKTRDMEGRIYEAGLRTGDLVYPMLYAPELLKSEFASKIADMKNSVKDRGNAQSSCAGHFIESHIDEDYRGDWVHVDMAGPATKNERATGYGVALVLGLLKAPGFD